MWTFNIKIYLKKLKKKKKGLSANQTSARIKLKLIPLS